MPSYYRRLFLNRDPHHSSAHLIARISEYGGTVELADCSRKINLDFDFSEEDGLWDNNLAKLDLLLTELKDFRKALVKAQRQRAKMLKGL